MCSKEDYEKVNLKILYNESKVFLEILEHVLSFKSFYSHINIMKYGSVLVNDLIKIFENNNISLDIDEDVKESIYRLRNSVKYLLDDYSISKYLKEIELSVDKFRKYLIKDYNYFQKCLVFLCGQEDFGIEFYNNKPTSNTIWARLNMVKLFKKEEYEEIFNGEIIFKVSSNISKIISAFVKGVDSNWHFKKSKKLLEFDNYDYQYKNDLVFNNNFDIKINTILLSIINEMNFIKLLDSIINRDNTFMFRMKYICLYSSINIMEKIINYENNNNNISGLDKKTVHSYIVFRDSRMKNIRNSMFHYEITKKDLPIIDNTIKNYYGLIENNCNINYQQLKNEIDDKLKNINEYISNHIKLNKGKLVT